MDELKDFRARRQRFDALLERIERERLELPHVHVDRDDLSAKFWLDPVGLARNLGFRPHELSRLERLVQENRNDFLEAWNEHLGA